MKQNYKASVSSSDINFYASNDAMDCLKSISFDEAFAIVNSHDDLVKALQESNNALKLFADKSKILHDAMQYNNEALAKVGAA